MRWNEDVRDALIVLVLLPLLIYAVVVLQNAGITTLLLGGLLTPGAIRIDAARRRDKDDPRDGDR